MAQDAERLAALSIAVDPAYAVVVVGAHARLGASAALVHVRLRHVDTEQHVQLFAGIGPARKPEELVLVKELLAAERRRQRAVGVVDSDHCLLGGFTMNPVTGADQFSKLGPVQ